MYIYTYLKSTSLFIYSPNSSLPFPQKPLFIFFSLIKPFLLHFLSLFLLIRMREGSYISSRNFGLYVMENQDFSPPQGDASRPSIGFPLGTALLLIVIFSLSGIFSCCYHWEKLRSLRQSFSEEMDPEADIGGSPTKSKPVNMDLKKNQSQSLPVLMPGDQIPKFMALPCPSEPPRAEKIVVKVQQPPMLPRLPVPSVRSSRD